MTVARDLMTPDPTCVKEDQTLVDAARLMRDLDVEWPGYGFAVNAGYGTGAHREALGRLGPTPVHRRSFRGVGTPPLFAAFD